MDKFGIFNLLSSIFGQQGGNFSDVTTGLLGNSAQNNAENISQNANVSSNDNDVISANARSAQPPLKNSMLKTMLNHDEFVKRVKNSIKP